MALREHEPDYRNEQEHFVSPERTSPSMLLINARMFLYRLGQKHGRPMTVKDIPDGVLDDIAARHDMAWFMGIYKPSPMGVQLARTHLDQYKNGALPDATLNDVIGSPFAVYDYSPDKSVAASWEEWKGFKQRLNDRNVLLCGDFIPNHIGIDHPWTKKYPEIFIAVDESTYRNSPHDYVVVDTKGKRFYYAKGRDPYFPSWEDTLQINYGHPLAHRLMGNVVLTLEDYFNILRCDMAMLVNANKFYDTWGWYLRAKGIEWPGDFWEKVVKQAKAKAAAHGRELLFMAETYDDYNNDLLGQYGFDYEYQKHFYDDLKRVAWNDPNIHPQNITDTLRHFLHTRDSQRQKWVMFVENHDEERAVHEFGKEASLAAAAISAFIPNSLFLVHEDQEKGFSTRPIVQLRRRREEVADQNIIAFYDRIFSCRNDPVFQHGRRDVPYPVSRGDGDISFANIVPQMGQLGDRGAMIYTNYSPFPSSGFLPLPQGIEELHVYDINTGRDLYANDIATVNVDGLWYVELPAWHSQIAYWRT